MEPLLIILIPGVIGGVLLALILAGTRHGTPSTFVPRRLAPPSPQLINMAHIRVEGIGGLGMVAAVAAVAIADPLIRLAVIVAFVLGAGLALCLIVLRRGDRSGSGRFPGGKATLRIDADKERTSVDGAAEIDGLERAGALIFAPVVLGSWRLEVGS
jgi:hypothetical protein